MLESFITYFSADLLLSKIKIQKQKSHNLTLEKPKK